MATPLLKLFTVPCITRPLGLPLFARLFGRFTHLLASNLSLPSPSLENPSYFDRLAFFLERPSELPAPLLQALHDIEAAAAAIHHPEAIPQDHPPANPENTASDRLRQAIELWLARPEQSGNGLAASKPGEHGPSAAERSADEQPSTINTQPSTPPSSQPSTHSEAPDCFAALARLAPMEYDRIRRAEARRLKIRVQTLDAEVERRRSQLDDANAHALQLPELEPWPEPVLNLAEVLDQVAGRYTLHIVLPSGAADALSLFTAHCHGPNAARQSPRLNLFSLEGGCGKTTTIEVMAAMVPRPLRAENMSPAVLFRVVAQPPPPTLFLDELDTWLAKDPELRGLLNAGHKPGSHSYRCEGRRNAIRAFKAYAPAVLAGIGSLPPTLRDRSILIPLTKAQEGQPHAFFDSNKTEIENTLGRKLARWAKDNFAALQACDPPLPPGAFNRLADNWRPLFAIAQLAGGDWPQRAAAAFASLTVKSTPQQHFVLTLIADIRSLFAQSGAQRIFSTDLANSLRAIHNRPYSQPPQITANRLSRRLAELGIHSKAVRIGQHRAKGYDLADFAAVFAHLPAAASPLSPPSAPERNPAGSK